MKIRPYKHMRGWFLITLLAMAVGVITLTLHPGLAQETKTDPKKDPVRITADELVIDNQKRSATFTGNVKATQADTVITTDVLTLFYQSQSGASQSPSTNAIERIEAAGNVRIEFDNKVAVSNQAVYIINERKLILSGPGSKVVSGQDEITGSKITFYRDSGKVALEGDDQNRVKAIIHSDQRSLN